MEVRAKEQIYMNINGALFERGTHRKWDEEKRVGYKMIALHCLHASKGQNETHLKRLKQWGGAIRRSNIWSEYGQRYYRHSWKYHGEASPHCTIKVYIVLVKCGGKWNTCTQWIE